jgi:putative IMPACT (imprinted ancient) family translation regulator
MRRAEKQWAFTKTTHHPNDHSQEVHNQASVQRSQNRNTNDNGERQASCGVTSIAHTATINASICSRPLSVRDA